MCIIYQIHYVCGHQRDVEIELCALQQPRYPPLVQTQGGVPVDHPPPDFVEPGVWLNTFTLPIRDPLDRDIMSTPESLINESLPAIYPAGSSPTSVSDTGVHISAATSNTYYDREQRTRQTDPNSLTTHNHACMNGIQTMFIYPPLPPNPQPIQEGSGSDPCRRRVDVCKECNLDGWWGADLAPLELNRKLREMARKQAQDDQRWREEEVQRVQRRQEQIREQRKRFAAFARAEGEKMAREENARGAARRKWEDKQREIEGEKLLYIQDNDEGADEYESASDGLGGFVDWRTGRKFSEFERVEWEGMSDDEFMESEGMTREEKEGEMLLGLGVQGTEGGSREWRVAGEGSRRVSFENIEGEDLYGDDSGRVTARKMRSEDSEQAEYEHVEEGGSLEMLGSGVYEGEASGTGERERSMGDERSEQGGYQYYNQEGLEMLSSGVYGGETSGFRERDMGGGVNEQVGYQYGSQQGRLEMLGSGVYEGGRSGLRAQGIGGERNEQAGHQYGNQEGELEMLGSGVYGMNLGGASEWETAREVDEGVEYVHVEVEYESEDDGYETEKPQMFL